MLGYFFDAVLTPEGEYDRLYSAIDHANFYKSFFGNGIFLHSNPNACLVTASDAAPRMLSVAAGRIFVEGYMGITDSSDQFPAIDLQDGYYRVVISLNRNETVRAFTCRLVFGSASAFPELRRDDVVYDMCLANVIVQNGHASVEDTRGNTELCGVIRLSELADVDGGYFQTVLDPVAEHNASPVAHQNMFVDGATLKIEGGAIVSLEEHIVDENAHQNIIIDGN